MNLSSSIAGTETDVTPPKAGDIWREPHTGMAFVWVPGGSFLMGCSHEVQSADCATDEKPAHPVTIDGLWMGRFPVTQGCWQRMMGENPAHFQRGDDYPVEKVSWGDVQKFIQALNNMGTGPFRLPTEAEWEYASRSGGKAEKYSGKNNSNHVAWYNARSTCTVGTKGPNGLGLFDMSGNVWEWVEDWYQENFYSTPQASSRNPVCTHPFSGCRVIRGGSWDSDSQDVRTTRRNKKKPSSRGEDVGFRLVRSSPTIPLPAAGLSPDPGPSTPCLREWQPGEVILDLYEVKAKLGEGNFGTVHLVKHRQWQTELAVKSPKPEIVAQAGGGADFSREAETWVNLGLHPHIVNCHYVREIEGAPRIFVEYVKGGNLQSWIHTDDDLPGPLYEGRANEIFHRILDIAIQFAWGLDFAHNNGIIHQDVKPANVMLTPEGLVKVTDFGLGGSKVKGRKTGEDCTMLADGIGGSPAYCSPEQAQFLFPTEANRQAVRKTILTRRSDLWSWAVCLLEMLIGKRHWSQGHIAGTYFESYLSSGKSPVTALVPPSLVTLLRKCFQPDPDQRFYSMMDVAGELIKIYEDVFGMPYSRQMVHAVTDSPESLNNRAVSMLDLGDQDGALRLLEQVLKSHPSHLEATFNWLLLQPELPLIKGFSPTYQDNKGQWKAEYLMAYGYFRAGFREKALHLLESIPVQDKQRHEIQQLIQTLYRHDPGIPPSQEIAGSHSRAQIGILDSQNQRLLTGDLDGSIKIWGTGERIRLIQKLDGHNASVSALALSGDRQWTLSGAADGSLRSWDPMMQVRMLPGHRGAILSVCLNADGRLALSGGADQVVHVWDMATGQCRHTLSDHALPVQAVAISRDGQYAVSGSEHVRLWNVTDGSCIRVLEGHTRAITSVFLTANDAWILSGSQDQTLKLWEVASGCLLRTFEGHMAMITATAISSDGRLILSGSHDGNLRLWDLSSGHCILNFQGHMAPITSVSLSQDNRLALSISGNEPCKLWDIHAIQVPAMTVGVQLAKFVKTEEALLANQDGDRILALARQAHAAEHFVEVAQLVRKVRELPGLTYHDEAMELWQHLYRCLPRSAWKGCWKSVHLPGHGHPIRSVALSEDAQWALTGSDDHTLKLWSVSNGLCLQTFTGHTDAVKTVCTTDEWVLSGSLDKTIRLWDRKTGECRRILTGHAKGVLATALSHDHRVALSGGADQSVKLWNIANGHCLHSCAGHEDMVTAVALSGDSRLALSGSHDKTVKLWSTVTGQCLHTMDGHQGQVLAVCLSGDGRLAASGGADMVVKLWDVATGQCRHTLAGHTGSISAVTLSLDSRLVLSASWDQTLRLWDTTHGLCLRIIESRNGRIYAAALSTDCRLAVSGSHDGSMDVWFFDWELEDQFPAYWAEEARVPLELFLTQHMPYLEPLPSSPLTSRSRIVKSLTRKGRPRWTDKDFGHLIFRLQCGGFGWLEPDGVRKKLEEMAETWEVAVINRVPLWFEALPFHNRIKIGSMIWRHLVEFFTSVDLALTFIIKTFARIVVGVFTNSFLPTPAKVLLAFSIIFILPATFSNNKENARPSQKQLTHNKNSTSEQKESKGCAARIRSLEEEKIKVYGDLENHEIRLNDLLRWRNRTNAESANQHIAFQREAVKRVEKILEDLNRQIDTTRLSCRM